MKNLNNPAARLLEIIQKSYHISKNLTCTQAWSELLDIPTKEAPLLLNRISKVFALPDEIEGKINILENQNPTLLLKWRPIARNALGNMNFQRKWGTFLDVFTSDIIYGIEICDDVLSRSCPEKTVEKDNFLLISTKIDKLIQFVENDSIETSSKQFILSSLLSLKNAIEELNICGIPSIEKTFNTIVGSIIIDNNINVLPKSSESANKFWEILGRIAIVLAIVTGPIAIGHEIINLIPENQESPQNESSKTNKDVVISTHKQTPKTKQQHQ